MLLQDKKKSVINVLRELYGNHNNDQHENIVDHINDNILPENIAKNGNWNTWRDIDWENVYTYLLTKKML